jgi:DNA-binding transcriptional MerR regulator
MLFTPEQAASLAGCTLGQLRYWLKTGLLTSAHTEKRGERTREFFDFRNLVELRTVTTMLRGGVSLQKIRKTIDYLRETGADRPLSQCKLVTDGSTIFEVTGDPGKLLDTLRKGQFAFFIALDAIEEEIRKRIEDFLRDKEVFIRRLLA